MGHNLIDYWVAVSAHFTIHLFIKLFFIFVLLLDKSFALEIRGGAAAISHYGD